MLRTLRSEHVEILNSIRDKRELTKDTEALLKGVIETFLKSL